MTSTSMFDARMSFIEQNQDNQRISLRPSNIGVILEEEKTVQHHSPEQSFVKEESRTEKTFSPSPDKSAGELRQDENVQDTSQSPDTTTDPEQREKKQTNGDQVLAVSRGGNQNTMKSSNKHMLLELQKGAQDAHLFQGVLTPNSQRQLLFTSSKSEVEGMRVSRVKAKKKKELPPPEDNSQLQLQTSFYNPHSKCSLTSRKQNPRKVGRRDKTECF